MGFATPRTAEPTGFATLLRDRKLLTEEQLTTGLAMAERDGLRLEQVLEREGIFSHNELLRIEVVLGAAAAS